MLLNVLREGIRDLLAEWDRQLLQLGILQEAHVGDEVLHRVLRHSGLQTGEVSLEDHGVLLLGRDGPRDLRGGTEVLLRGLAVRLDVVRGDLVELGWVGHDDEVLGEGGVEHLGQLTLHLLGAHALIGEEVGIILPLDALLGQLIEPKDGLTLLA